MAIDWGTLVSTFGFVFVAELGDKTQLAVISQTCKFRRPWPVFLGSSAALIATTALGTIGGRALSAILPPNLIRYVAAAAFIVMGLFIWREAARKQAADLSCTLDETECELPERRQNWKAFSATFGLLFLAELGDKTQLSVMGLASKAAPWSVFVGGTAALTAVTALGVLGGQQLARLIPEVLLLRISAIAFVILGVLMGLGVI